MSKKNTVAPVSIIDSLGLPELPAVMSAGAFDPDSMSYRDISGLLVQGPGVKEGASGIHLVCVPKDAANAERTKGSLQRRGYALITGDKIRCVGFESGEVFYTTWSRYLELQAAEDKALSPAASGNDGGVEFETKRTQELVDLGDGDRR